MMSQVTGYKYRVQARLRVYWLASTEWTILLSNSHIYRDILPALDLLELAREMVGNVSCPTL